MTFRVSTSVAQAFADLIGASMDGGPGAATVKVYTGSQPAHVEDSATGTLLATFTLNDPSTAAAFVGSPTFIVAGWETTPTISATVVATGTAGWFRVATSAGTAVFDGACGVGSGEFDLSSVSWTSGDTVTLDSGSSSLSTS